MGLERKKDMLKRNNDELVKELIALQQENQELIKGFQQKETIKSEQITSLKLEKHELVEKLHLVENTMLTGLHEQISRFSQRDKEQEEYNDTLQTKVIELQHQLEETQTRASQQLQHQEENNASLKMLLQQKE